MPRINTKTLLGKVKWVIDRFPSMTDSQLVVEVWREFYWQRLDDPYKPDPLISLSAASLLPGPERILASARRVKGKTAIPAPYYSQMP